MTSAALPMDQIPVSDQNEIRRMVLQQLEEMDTHELRIATRTEDSLSYFIASAARHFALAMGYILVLPIAWAVRIGEELVGGFSEGWRRGWNSTRFSL